MKRPLKFATSLLALVPLVCAGEPLPGAEEVEQDEQRIAAALIDAIKTISRDRYPDGTVKRFNQSKNLACLNADFHVPENLPPRLRQGLFARPGHYPAKLRFANARNDDDRDKDIHGLSIKVAGVAGESLWGEAGTQDFLINSYPALFAATPEEFLDFVEAQRDDALWRFFINPFHLDSAWILWQGRETIASPLDIRYWSTTPYRFGADSAVAVKYSAQPCSTVSSAMPATPDADYLSRAIERHLEQTPACFDFMVQFQADPDAMPIEDATVIWDEADAPFHKVARITAEQQDFSTEESMAECERLAFNPWQSLAEHRPLGGINRVRKQVYGEIERFRNQRSRENRYEPNHQ